MKKVVLVVMALLAIYAVNGNAKEETSGFLGKLKEDFPIDLSTEIAFYSDYVWRGFELDGDPVIQPAISIGAYGVTGTFWSSFDVISDDALDGDEVDFTLDYTYEHDLFSISFGHTWYTFPPADTDTQEFYIGGSINIPITDELALSPYGTWYHDYGDTDDGGAKGNYFIFGLDHSIPVMEGDITLDLSTNIAYNNEFFIEGDGGYFLIGGGLTVPLYKNIILRPNISYSVPFGNLSDSDDGNQDKEFYFGSNLIFNL